MILDLSLAYDALEQIWPWLAILIGLAAGAILLRSVKQLVKHLAYWVRDQLE